MTAKEKLAERIDAFTEEEAEEALALLFVEEEGEWPDFPPAPPSVMEQFKRAMVDSDAGRTTSDSEMRRRFGIE
jgi:hypothetical protein